MVVKVSLFNNLMNQSVVLSNDEITIIGRGFFECQDKRVSKKHGEITVLDSTIKIKSCHQNPIFYKIKNDPKKNVLRKDSEVILGDSDRFSLLPEEFEWTIKIEQENDQNENPTSTFRIRQTDEINANLTQLLREGCETPDLEGCETPDLEGRETPDLERTPSPENLRPPQNYHNNQEDALVAQEVSSSSRKRSFDNSGETENLEIKKQKQVPCAQVPSSTTSENVQQTTSDSSVVPQSSDSNSSTLLTNIKPDPDSTEINNQQNPTDQNVPSTSTIKTEPAENNDQHPSSSNSDVKVDTSTVKKEENPDNSSCQQQTVRPSCEFGIRCYRMTDDHRREYSHPMENDYRRPNFPPAPANAPRCPYWDACYRRNPDHFREMAHPSSDSYTTQRPPQIHIQIHQVVPPANQPPNRIRICNNQNFAEDDDDIFDSDSDMFNDGDDSDVDQDYEIDYSQSTFDEDEDNEYEENNLEE
jgi:aprataxin and PNK-like factor